MVAKINRGVSLYGAVAYNHQKVDRGTARIIAGNRMIGSMGENPEQRMPQTLRSFENYLLANKNTEKPILHISLNPSLGDELTDEEFAALARDYMEKMGYGDQPYVVYLHEDIGRRHIHIVTTCVDERGDKISDAYEWNRSMKACRELETKYSLKRVEDKRQEMADAYLRKADYTRGDVKSQISNILKSVVPTYRFQSFGEYSALLLCFNIEAKQVRGEHNGEPYTGIVYSITDDQGIARSAPIKSSLLDKRFGFLGLDKRMANNIRDFKAGKWSAKIQGTIAHAMLEAHGSREAFLRLLRCHNLDACFRVNDRGRIYGVTFIDHMAHEVYNGSRLGKEFSANVFNRLFCEPQDFEPRHAYSPGLSAADVQSAIEQAFGLLSFEQHGPDPEEEAFARRIRRRAKKKKHTRGIS